MCMHSQPPHGGHSCLICGVADGIALEFYDAWRPGQGSPVLVLGTSIRDLLYITTHHAMCSTILLLSMTQCLVPIGWVSVTHTCTHVRTHTHTHTHTHTYKHANIKNILLTQTHVNMQTHTSLMGDRYMKIFLGNRAMVMVRISF